MRVSVTDKRLSNDKPVCLSVSAPRAVVLCPNGRNALPYHQTVFNCSGALRLANEIFTARRYA